MTTCVTCGLEMGSDRRKYCSEKCKSQYFRNKRTPKTESLIKTNHELENYEPKTVEYYTRYDGEKRPLNEYEMISEGIDFLRSKIIGKNKVEEIKTEPELLTVDDMAIRRAAELNGELLGQETFAPETSTIEETPKQNPPQPIDIFNLFRPKKVIKEDKKEEIPQRQIIFSSVNHGTEFAGSLGYSHTVQFWFCENCKIWLSSQDRHFHQIENRSHNIKYIPLS